MNPTEYKLPKEPSRHRVVWDVKFDDQSEIGDSTTRLTMFRDNVCHSTLDSDYQKEQPCILVTFDVQEGGQKFSDLTIKIGERYMFYNLKKDIFPPPDQNNCKCIHMK